MTPAQAVPYSVRMGYALDRIISVVAPGLGNARLAARDDLTARMYAAAKPTEDLNGWLPYDGDVNSVIRSSSTTVRSRVRQLVRDFPYAKRAEKLRNALIVGNGIRMQARFKSPDGTMNREVNKVLEGSFAEWAQKADITETQSFVDLQNLADRQLFECGEYFFIKRYMKGKKHPLRLQPIEADRLPFGDGTAKVADGHEIKDGIEYEKATGKPVFYHFQDDGFAAKAIRVPADLVIHGYEMERPGQLRGISPIASAVMVAGNLADLLDSELEAMRMAARHVAFVQTNDIPGFQKGVNSRGKGQDGKKKSNVEYLNHATIQYLRQGDNFTLAKVDRQSGTFEPYIKFNVRTFVICAGLTYELVSGDYDKISYSNLRGIRMDLSVVIQPIQRQHIGWLCRPVSAAWLESSMLSIPALLPYARLLTPKSYAFIAPGMESADRLKDVKADADEIDLGVNSPQRICSRRGVDYREILDELKEAKDEAERRGLTLGNINTALATNPAELMADGGKEEG